MNRGLLYLAKGETFVAEAERSAQRTATVMPQHPITIVADREPDADCFDTVIIDRSSFEKRDKPLALQQTPYDRTIYLDTDTYLTDSIDGLFEILDAFDVGLRRDQGQSHVPESSQLPKSFPQFNSGVITYQSTQGVRDMLKDWAQRCRPTDTFDQRSLRPALYHSEVRFTPLPNRYNCQYHWKNVVDGPVKVFHGPLVEREARSILLEEATSKLNSSHDVRLHYKWGGALFVDPTPPFWTRVSTWMQLIARRHGMQELLARIAKKLLRRLFPF
ncbi:putative nucleotide-diphospho-sugar transferase [Salinibacter altiplanensis]|uniref:putative nucleotide-diphospho-sugar transferase n=1 Tax=Salinibacter altiplanensis TaxID=1803181 RepID=UPI000C9FBDBF|nr:putative nucleotide-diphospho-sugar transferase [Salinibacter altiplanensis]